MPGKKPKRLVRLKNRNFRYVQNLPTSQQPGPGIKWSSCNSTMNGGKGGKGGSGRAFQTATGVSYYGRQLMQIGEGIVVTGLVFSVSVIGAALTLPMFAFGAGLNAYGKMQTVGWSRPCSDKDESAGLY